MDANDTPTPIKSALAQNIERLRHLETIQTDGDISADLEMEIQALSQAIQILKEVEEKS